MSASAAPVLTGTTAPAPHSGAGAPQVSLLRGVRREGDSQSGSIAQHVEVLAPHAEEDDVRLCSHALQHPVVQDPVSLCAILGRFTGVALLFVT